MFKRIAEKKGNVKCNLTGKSKHIAETEIPQKCDPIKKKK